MAVYPTSHVIELYTGGSWTNISAAVVTDLDAEQGLTDESYENRLADPGELIFDLNNADGSYSDIMKGTPVRVRVSYDGRTKTKFYGYVEDADIDAGEFGEQRVHVTVSDWLSYAAKQPVRERPVETSKRFDEAVNQLLLEAAIAPPLTLLEQGSTVLPTVYDDIDRNTTLYRELNNLILSEYGYGYLDRGGERFRLENRKARTALTPVKRLPVASNGDALKKVDGDYLLKVDGGKILLNQSIEASFTEFEDLKVLHGKHVLNEIDFTVYPKWLDSSVQVLFGLPSDGPIFIPALSTVEVDGYFSDPRGGGRIGGTSFVDPVASLDYFAFENSDGTGTNLTANVTIAPTYSADRVKFRITNAGVGAWVTHLNLRGKGIYPDNPVSVLRVDTASRKEHGAQPLSIKQIYQQDVSLATFEAERILDIEREPRNVAIRATFTANLSDKNMQAFLHVDIGDLVRIVNTKPAVDSYYFVNGIRWKITQGGLITFTWILKERPSFSPIAIEFPGVGAKHGVDFGRPPALRNLLQKTYSLWLYQRTATISGTPVMAKYSGTAQAGIFHSVIGANKLTVVQGMTSSVGQWTTTGAAMSGLSGQWVHIAYTLDASSPLNDPIIYVNGVSQPLTEDATPAGVISDDSPIKFIMGNGSFPGFEFIYQPDFIWKDARVYSRCLNLWEIMTLHNSPNNYDIIQDGLVFQAGFVRSMRLADYIDNTITDDMKIFDRVNEIVGATHYDTAIAGWEIVGRDPSLTTYP